MSTWKRFVMVVVVSFSVVGLAFAQSAEADNEKKGKMVDLDSFVCKDLMRTSGEDRNIGLALLQGYFLGKKGITTYDAGKVAEITDQFVEYCLDNPNTKVLEAMGKFAK